MAKLNSNQKYYSGKYKIKNLSKYAGDPSDVKYRSSWEKSTFIWLENSDRIKKWASESVTIPYESKLDGMTRRYIVDLYIEWIDGTKEIVEIKPQKETKPPVKSSAPIRRNSRYITEATTYIKNSCKWEAASSFAKNRGWKFSIWDEHKLKNLGVRIN